MIKRMIASLMLVAVLAIGLVGCASNEAKPAAMTGGESHAYQDTHWSQP